MNHHLIVVRLKAVYNHLGELKDKVVFVGGATVSLYADLPTLSIRPTDDIDVIIEVLDYGNRIALEEKLRSMGFQHDIQSGIICRYTIQGIIVDIMPTTSDAMGFSNKWYPAGFVNAVGYSLGDVSIKILSAPYFIATKFEAFKGRGGDGRTSHDFEDIVYVLENRQQIWQEMSDCIDSELKNYLIETFRELKNSGNLSEWMDCHIDFHNQGATAIILEKIDEFIA